MNSFEEKAELVRHGRSKIFDVWHLVLPSLEKDEFISALKWVCEDDKEKVTRGMGLTPEGITKLSYEYKGNTCEVRRTDTNEKWTGARFHIPCFDDRYADLDGTILQRFRLDLNSNDNV